MGDRLKGVHLLPQQDYEKALVENQIDDDVIYVTPEDFSALAREQVRRIDKNETDIAVNKQNITTNSNEILTLKSETSSNVSEIVNVKNTITDIIVRDTNQDNRLTEIENNYANKSNVVTLSDTQIITGPKTFTEHIYLANSDGTVDRISHLNNNFIIHSGATNSAVLNIDEGLSKIYAFNKELAFKSDVVDASGTLVKVGGTAVADLSFSADPQTQINEANTKADNAVSVANSANATANQANNTASEVLSQVVSGLGTKVYAGGTLQTTFDADTKANQSDLNTTNTQVNTNKSNIATNTTNIATNTSDIATLKTSKANQSDLVSTNAKVTTLTNNKADKDLSNVNFPKFSADSHSYTSSGYTTYMSIGGDTWYILFPTGLKICHLSVTVPSTDNKQQVTLPIVFKTVHYMVNIERSSGSSYLRFDDVGVTDKTTSGFKIRGYNSPALITCIGY